MPLSVAEARAFALEVVAPAIYPERIPLEVSARHLVGEPEPPAEAVNGRFEPFSVGDRWGGMWSTTWLRCQAAVPSGWAGAEVAALVHLGGARVVGFSAEGLVWSADLEPVQGLHHEHRECSLFRPARGGERVDFYVEAAANPIPRWHVKDWPRLEPDYRGPPLYALEQAELAVVDRDVEALWIDMDTVVQIAEWMENRREEALAALTEAVAIVTAGDDSACCASARALLQAVLARSGPPPEPGGRHTVIGVGHAHIDTAWLWPVRETKRKCVRSFANQLRLLDRYPEHHFVCSQAVQYQWVKEGYPQIYERIRRAVAAGRWEPVGGMWVEADTNMPSGESLVRQFVHGKRFFLDEFGVETHEMWIPDVFGYCAALPQIAAGAGVTALVTQKMSWNDTNPFPYSTFWWEGHDGTRILAHFPPAATYNGGVTVAELLADQRNFRDGPHSSLTLYPFGYGDGGGGPSAHQLESARRLADVEGLPRLEMGSAAGFLASVTAEAAGGEPLATWVGELYLEAHRATTTTHAGIKAGNRRGEEALRAAEMWAVAAGPVAPSTVSRLDGLWKLLLLNQFHDILPGSSIAWVYRDAARDHDAVLAGCRELADDAQSRIAAPDGGQLVVFNASTYDREEVVELPDGGLTVAAVPGCGWAPLPVADPHAVPLGRSAPVDAGDGYLDNGLVRVSYDRSGLVTSIWDHEAEREVLAPGERANLFQIHEDHPKAFDAWDVDREYLQSVTDLDGLVDPGDQAAIVDSHPLRGGVRWTRRFGASVLTQVMRLHAGSRRIEFHTEIDWQERHRFLKVAFPVAIRAAEATFEMQHGHVRRPTHANTTWDQARFEVCGHRWADLGETGYGVALLNDAKYGYDVRGHTLRLSLLRGPGYPDPDADRGRHRFAYALLPHRGDIASGRVVEEAEAFNLALTIRPGRTGESGGTGQIVSVDRPGVSVEAVKPADRTRGVVVRLCEVHDSRGPVRITVGFDFSSVVETDLLERPQRSLPAPDGVVTVDLRPFQLVTLLFTVD